MVREPKVTARKETDAGTNKHKQRQSEGRNTMCRGRKELPPTDSALVGFGDEDLLQLGASVAAPGLLVGALAEHRACVQQKSKRKATTKADWSSDTTAQLSRQGE